jgi:hypothetical protein
MVNLFVECSRIQLWSGYWTTITYFRVKVTLELTVGRSVSHSVRPSVLFDIEPFWDSWPDFGCSQDSYVFVCHGASCLTRGWVCLVTGPQSLSLLGIYTYVHFYKFFHSFFFFNSLLLPLRLISPGFVEQVMLIAHLLPKDISTS